MSEAGGVGSARPTGGLGGSVWARPEPPETAPSLLSFAAADLVAVMVTWFVFTVLVSIAFLTGILTSEGLTTTQFYDRAESWVLVLVVPLSAVAYLAAIRGTTGWFANRPVSWPDAAVALLVTIASAAVFAASTFGIGVLSTLTGCLLVGAFFRLRAARRDA